jgi:hypothetical protein
VQRYHSGRYALGLASARPPARESRTLPAARSRQLTLEHRHHALRLLRGNQQRDPPAPPDQHVAVQSGHVELHPALARPQPAEAAPQTAGAHPQRQSELLAERFRIEHARGLDVGNRDHRAPAGEHQRKTLRRDLEATGPPPDPYGAVQDREQERHPEQAGAARARKRDHGESNRQRPKKPRQPADERRHRRQAESLCHDSANACWARMTNIVRNRRTRRCPSDWYS